MDETQQLRISTQVHSRLSVLDRSGQLPFSIAFGLCRRSPADTDPRPLVLRTARSALDIPYALAHGLLTLHERGSEEGQDFEVDVSCLTKTEGGDKSTYVVLPSPINRAKGIGRIAASTTYQYHVEAKSKLASLLAPGKKYTIQLAGTDLGVEWHAYGELDQLVSSEGKTTQPSNQEKLISGTRSGHARFRAVSSLSWPPRVTMHAQLYSSEISSSCSTTPESAMFLELSITNEGDRSVSIQHRGRQKYLIPWGPFEPERPTSFSLPHMLHPDERYARLSLQITNTDTGVVVYGDSKPPACDLHDISSDSRPMLSYFVTLKPGEPLVKRINITKTLLKLPDGRYSIRIPPQSAWWCYGIVEEIPDKGDNRVPKRLYKTSIPPLTLEAEIEVNLQIEGGSCVVEERNA
ncbi:hypothetical protein K431DRAFT_267273 [Polychaeton citri CBS 116435]|uniref:Uncharacterized protein n=1 Tax=Polychaeton citri CBS 116435 TaxID=1314669 RepID=A0A9P4URI0_9PEZI|nr:hypothetical protein K431DRAFT_267273 [Polychaeton citri CBS 116435]